MFQSKKSLAVFLSKLEVFVRPDPLLEQYPTDSEVAASILWDALMEGVVENRKVIDLGCGTGILGIGALALGASHVVFIDKDPRVLPQLMNNISNLEDETEKSYSNYDLVNGSIENYSERADVVIMNPPFGARQKHADLLFLEKALTLAPTVYSLHKTSTLDFLHKWLKAQGAQLMSAKDYDFPLKNTLPEHKKRLQRIEVSCLHIQS